MGDCDEWALEVKELKETIIHQKEVIGNLTKEKERLENVQDELNKEISDTNDACEDAEIERDQRTEEKDQAVEDLRQVRRSMLEFLRTIEFGRLSWICPRCRHDWQAAGEKKPGHGLDCELKLMIFQLDMDLTRPTYKMA